MAVTKAVGGNQVRIDDGYSHLSTDDDSLNIEFTSYNIVDGGIVLLTTEVGPVDDGAFTIPREAQNVVRVDPTLELDWIVDVDEDHAETVDGYKHKQFFYLGGRLITRADSKHFFEIDPATGAIERSWTSGEFVVGGERFAFRAPIQHVTDADDLRVLLAASSAYGTIACAVDEDGVERWRYTDSSDAFGLEADSETVNIVRGRAKNVVLDAETGERVN